MQFCDFSYLRQIAARMNARGFFAIAIGALFLTAQSLAAVHASEFGDDNHMHAGKVCALGVVASADDTPTPTQSSAIIVTVVFASALPIAKTMDIATSFDRVVAPTRGPPATL